MKLSKILGTLMLVGTVGAATNAYADACKDVKFKFTNKHSSGRAVKVLKVKFYNKDEGKWRTEDIKDTECDQAKTCTTSGDNLSDAEGQNISKLRFVYKYKERDGDWSDEVEGGDKEPSDQRCQANRTYGSFDITG